MVLRWFQSIVSQNSSQYISIHFNSCGIKITEQSFKSSISVCQGARVVCNHLFYVVMGNCPLSPSVCKAMDVIVNLVVAGMWKNFGYASLSPMYVSIDRCLILDLLMATSSVLVALGVICINAIVSLYSPAIFLSCVHSR